MTDTTLCRPAPPQGWSSVSARAWAASVTESPPQGQPSTAPPQGPPRTIARPPAPPPRPDTAPPPPAMTSSWP